MKTKSQNWHLLKDIKESLLHLAFPHVCAGCGDDVIEANDFLCLSCINALPKTNFHLYSDNPVAHIFTGRLPIQQATAHYYFTKASLMQRLLHQFKYRQNKALGYYLGELMGNDLQHSQIFRNIDALVPLPLYASKERKRGYNQAAILCKGIATLLQKPVLDGILIRTEATETQTKKNRVERWQNIEGKFQLIDNESIKGKHILLIDDVVTTGATLEAAGIALLEEGDVKLSIATLCISSS